MTCHHSHIKDIYTVNILQYIFEIVPMVYILQFRNIDFNYINFLFNGNFINNVDTNSVQIAAI